MKSQPLLRSLPSLFLLAASLFVPALLRSQEAGTQTPAAADAKPLVTIESISIEPGSPGPDTLCKLRVTLRNQGAEIASQLGFSVKINGQELGVYGNQLFMYPVGAQASEEIPLYNFWSTETSREMPKNGKMTVEVSLNEARWMKIADDEEGVEVWTPLGDVEGLPVSSRVTLTMKKAV